MSFFKINERLRQKVAALETLNALQKHEYAEAIDIAKSKAEALDLELNGRPPKYGMYDYRPAINGVKAELKDRERELRYALNTEQRLRTELDRINRHNLALREALTALGGAVIELQDHIEVSA